MVGIEYITWFTGLDASVALMLDTSAIRQVDSG